MPWALTALAFAPMACVKHPGEAEGRYALAQSELVTCQKESESLKLENFVLRENLTEREADLEKAKTEIQKAAVRKKGRARKK